KDGPVNVERAFSAEWHLPKGRPYRLSHLTGRWLDEFHLRRDALPHGLTVLESRRLTTSHHHNPWFALDDGSATEEAGEVYFGLLAWSGNWRLTAEVTDFDSTRVNIGLNDFDFTWRLNAGEDFETPHALAGFTTGGFGTASRILHRLIRAGLPHGAATHPVLYNSWEATFFDVSETHQKELATLAASVGVELFVVDDGWFVGRKDDTAGLGDWTPDPAKFPNGLNPLIQHVQGLGMAFGLWVEPEMVNPRSALYAAHPDWVLHFPTREREEARNQLILNLARVDVQDHLINVLDDLLTQHDIDFIKWDMNRNPSQPGWETAPGDPREVWARYVYGLYRVLDTLRERHPNVTFQSCSGGGGRVDAAILKRADQAWASDNTLADARLHIQHGFSQAYPAGTMECWVTDSGAERFSLEYRFHVAMAGVLGIGANLNEWTDADQQEARALIAEYKTWRPVVQQGEQHRLLPPENPLTAVQYVTTNQNEAVLIAARTHQPEPADLPPVRLRGLDANATYTLRANGRHASRQNLPATASGATLMHHGLKIDLRDFQSVTVHLKREG
ncbi:MAG TPA: alpha-galactosidase, partial [Deinococcales bacterium]|nr:alpha-galactosidase [Deinococcales bacterium]